MEEYNDVYDKNRNLTGRVHLRGTPWRRGEYGLTVCVWIYDGKGKILLTKRDASKSYGGTWENTGGAALAGENSLQAIARELFEETGIRAEVQDFEFLGSTTDRHMHIDHYCILRTDPIEDIVLLPGETVVARWVSFAQIHSMIRKRLICRVIARQFLRYESVLRGKSGDSTRAPKEKS